MALLVGLASTAGTACYTTPINRVPTVSISRVGEIYRQQLATFRVDAVDPDADALTIGWAWTEGDCPDARDKLNWPQIQDAGPLELHRTFPLTPDMDGPFCVWAFATDRHQAVTPVNDSFKPQNRAPVPMLDLAMPDRAPFYPLNTNFVFNGNRSSDADHDPITDFHWFMRAVPTGFTGSLAPCSDTTPDGPYCLQATVPGRYIVALEVYDGIDGFEPTANPDTLTLDVLPDQPPCIATTSPPLGTFWDGDPTSDATFRVTSADDDGDPQDLHYVWYYARAGEPWTVVSIDFPELNIKPSTFLEGDMAEVRVEIHDSPNRSAIDNALLMCDEQAFCAVQASSGCFQRVTWMVRWIL